MMVGTVRTFTPRPGTSFQDILDAAGPVRVLERIGRAMFAVESLVTGERFCAYLDELSMGTE